MVRTISTKLAVDGEAQYKQSIAACNTELKTLKSGLSLVESEFRNNANSMEALTAKGEALENMYQKQLEKVTTLETALLNAKRAQEEYTSRLSAAQGDIERCKHALERLGQSTGDTSAEQKTLTEELEKYQRELAEAQAGQAAAERGVQNWQRQLNSAKVELNGLSDAIGKNNQYLREAEQSADGCARSIDQYGKEVKQAGESAEKFAEGTHGSKEGINRLAAALAAAGVAKAVKEIADTLLECSEAAGAFETAMAKLSTLVDGSTYSMDGIKAELVELSNETGVAVGALAEAAYQARSAGVDTAGVVEFVSTAVKTSAAGFTDSATAVDVLTTAINAYKLQGSDAERVASMLVKTQDEGKTSVGELAQNMGRVIPVAAAYNVSLGNLTTAYAQLTKNGTNTAISTTNLTAMFTELGKDGSNVAKILQEQTGQSFSQLMAGGKDLGQVMAILSDSVEGDATAFSNLWGSTTAGQAALSLLNSGAEEFSRTLDVMEASSGAVDRNFQAMADTTEFAQQRMANAADNLKIAIGDQLNPALEKLYATGADAFTWATDFVEGNPWVVGAIAGTTTALAVLTTGVTLYSHKTELATAKTAILNAVMEANPAIFVAAALVGLATGIGLYLASIDDASEGTREFTQSLQDSKSAYDDLMASMGQQQTSTKSTAAALKDLLSVEDKSALQKDLIRQKVDELNEAVPDLGLAYNEEKDALEGLTAAELDSALARAGAQEEYAAQVNRLSELYSERAEIEARLQEADEALTEAQENLTDAQRAGYDEMPGYFDIAADYNNAVSESDAETRALENDVRALTAAQEENAAQIAALEEASGAYAEQQAEHDRRTQEMAATVDALTAEIKELQAAYDESYNSAMESISAQLGLFREMDGEAKTSIDSLIGTLEGQVSYMENYAANIQRAMELGVDEGLIRKLSDGSEESAQILDAIVKGGGEDIAALNEQFAKVEQGKEAFSKTVAEMEHDFSNQMEKLNQDLADAVEEMDQYDRAFEINQNNLRGAIAGVLSLKPQLEQAYAGAALGAMEAYKRTTDQHSPSKKFEQIARFDVLGAVEGVEAEKARLVAAYADLAREAMAGYEAAAAEGMSKLSAAFKELEGFLDARGDVGSLEYQLWERTVGKNATDAEKYARQLALLTEKQKDQQTVVQAAAEAYEAAVAQYGEGTAESLKYQKALLEEKLALQDVRDEIEQLNDARVKAAEEMGLKRVEAFNEWARGDRSSPFFFYGDLADELNPAGFDAAYQQAAQAVRDGMARHLPSTIEEPQPGAGAERRLESITAAAVNAISGIAGSGNTAPISLKLVFPDGTEFASYYFDPMAKYADANGTPILNPTK